MTQEHHGPSSSQELPPDVVEKIPSIRAKLQAECMQALGASDKNYQFWRTDHYSEDYHIAFQHIVEQQPEVIVQYSEHHDDVFAAVKRQVEFIHAQRGLIMEELIRKSVAGFPVHTIDMREDWIKKYDDIYNKVFNKFAEENYNLLSNIDPAVAEIKERMDRLIGSLEDENVV